MVERLFAWFSRYRRLNIEYDRAPDLFAGHIWTAMISIISRQIDFRREIAFHFKEACAKAPGRS